MAGVIYTIGETVLDIIFRDGQPGSGISFAAEVCKSLENYISHGFSKSLIS